jgi:hypothetical protein
MPHIIPYQEASKKEGEELWERTSSSMALAVWQAQMKAKQQVRGRQGPASHLGDAYHDIMIYHIFAAVDPCMLASWPASCMVCLVRAHTSSILLLLLLLGVRVDVDVVHHYQTSEWEREEAEARAAEAAAAREEAEARAAEAAAERERREAEEAREAAIQAEAR